MNTPARLTLALCAALVALAPARAAEPELLRILGEDKSFVIQTPTGPMTITRTMTPCAKNKGWLQPLVPVAGVHPVGEIEILGALNDKDAIVVDMRESEDRVKGTIPNTVSIPYTEVAGRMDELGCKKVGKGWDCTTAKKVYAFCNGPVCPQSPTAILAMTRDGFPADRIYYYRGGMLDWEALGFPLVKGDF
ncbi:rhodanese-like domain-containing protein [Sphaerotilus sp.]|uniref:rhodanese-like domain-containing protein n=1 Tax=Sphaerotilus sp. TaxID=2093942 RepID=UPI002ACEA697|nr:rhodanese-like domain-containing protein [Sphaerotilus sp.]MDZ7857386.1 rhodanese-like domain-containing protein [Sphaerotilus sp.]